MSAPLSLTVAQERAVRSVAADHGGTLRPADVVAAARHPESPLHPLFDWHDGRAAEKWRHQQARIVIGSVRVQITHEDVLVRVPAYAVTSNDGSGYKSVAALRRSPESARASLIYTLKVAAGHLQRARDLAVPLQMEAELDDLVEQVTGLVQKLETPIRRRRSTARSTDIAAPAR